MIVRQNYPCVLSLKKGDIIVLYYIILLSDMKQASNKSN